MKDRLQSLLFEWGRWVWASAEFASYPRQSSLVRVIEDHVYISGIPSHRILCMDVRSKILWIDGKIRALPHDYRIALAVRFIAPPKPNGSYYSQSELAALIGVPTSTFRCRIARAKRLLRDQPVSLNSLSNQQPA